MKKIVILLLVFWGLVETCRAGKRVALVIGNANYSIANGRLSNPVNDAIGVAEELEKLGYRVDLQTDLEDREAMEIAVEKFAEASAGAEISLFYYSGHGVQYDGKNYLMPTRASINNARQIRHRAMNVGFVLDEISAGGGLHLVILDACRDNPYPRDSKSGGGKGMARMDAPSSTIIAYATKPDATAADGDGNHSPYTRQLLNHLRIEPSLPIDEVLNRINVAVEDDTDRQQSPRLEMSPLRARYCFGLCGQLGDPVTKTTHALTVKTSPADATVRILNIAPKYRDGIELKPGRYHLEATAPGFRRHTEWIELGAEDSVHSVVLQEDGLNRPEVTSDNTSTGGLSTPRPSVNGHDIELVWIEPGCFQMGSPESEAGHDDDETQHEVCLSRGYYIGKYEVTQRQWQAVMGYNPSWFKNCGLDCPVEQVSWEDVQRFIDELNRRSGLRYRLPTEAEWEYAARGGDSRSTYNGNLTLRGNYNASEADAIAWYGGNSRVSYSDGYACSDWRERPFEGSFCGTHPVGQKRANAFGLYDMLGNVYEWTSSVYVKRYDGNEKTSANYGNAWRALRGGSWTSRAAGVRSAHRFRRPPSVPTFDLGFRVVQDPQL